MDLLPDYAFERTVTDQVRSGGRVCPAAHAGR